jgi:hypothetical protein
MKALKMATLAGCWLAGALLLLLSAAQRSTMHALWMNLTVVIGCGQRWCWKPAVNPYCLSLKQTNGLLVCSVRLRQPSSLFVVVRSAALCQAQ